MDVVTTGAEPTVDEALAVLRGRIVEAETGSPLACSVSIHNAQGRLEVDSPSFPAGFRCPGEFVRRLPPGPTRIRVTRGFEFATEEQTIELGAGVERRLSVELKRTVDLRERGWFAGDSHAHMIHGERTVPVDFDEVALAARAEDLRYLSLSHAWALNDPTPERLDRELLRRTTPDCALTWNLEAPKNYYRGDAGRCLGHCWSVGMRGRTVGGDNVIDLLLASSAADYESAKPSFANFESHALIRAQGGAVFYTHPLRWWMGPWGGQGGYARVENMRVSNLAVELPLDTLIGPTFDGIDLITTRGEVEANAAAFELWALLLNHGYRLAATASSDACFDRPGGAVPGAARTYTFLEEPFSLAAIARATAAGRTFATTGPLLLAALDDRPPGTVFKANGQARRLAVEAWASGSATGGLARVELLRNGKPVRTVSIGPGVRAWQTNLVLREADTAWYCLRAWGDEPQQRERAITGAFFFEGANYQPPQPESARVLVRLVAAETGQPLSGKVTEVTYQGPLMQDGRRHEVGQSGVRLAVAGTSRLRAEVEGRRSVTLSPFLDSAPLREFVTSLQAADLVDWQTFETIRGLLSEIVLTFTLERNP